MMIDVRQLRAEYKLKLIDAGYCTTCEKPNDNIKYESCETCREKRRAYMRKWIDANRERFNEYMRKYREKAAAQL